MRGNIFKKVHINGLSLILNVNEMKDKQNRYSLTHIYIIAHFPGFCTGIAIQWG